MEIGTVVVPVSQYALDRILILTLFILLSFAIGVVFGINTRRRLMMKLHSRLSVLEASIWKHNQNEQGD